MSGENLGATMNSQPPDVYIDVSHAKTHGTG